MAHSRAFLATDPTGRRNAGMPVQMVAYAINYTEYAAPAQRVHCAGGIVALTAPGRRASRVRRWPVRTGRS